MLQETNLAQVKSIAKMMLLMELHETEFSPAVVQHPFTSSGIAFIQENGETTLLNLVQKKEDLHTWQIMMSRQIEKAGDAFGIYMMVNKPYAITFLKFASPYLSREDFSKILSSAWMQSENPNCDPNVGQRKLIAMFKDADPDVLMDEDERKELDAMDTPVTVYRGVTSYNADHVRAMSWTLDYEVAKWFAHRYGEDGTVYQAQIDKEHILALFNGRNESEIIVDSRYLIDIEPAESPGFSMTMT